MLSSRVARVLGTDLGNIQCIWGVQSVLSRSLATLHATCLSSAAVSASAQRCDGATQSSNAASTRVDCHINNLQHPQLDTSGHQQQLAVQQQQQRLGHALSTDLQSQHLSQWPWRQQPCGLMQQQPRQQLPPQQQWRRSISSSSGVPGSAEDGSPKWRVYPSGPQQQPGIQPAAVARAASSMQQPQAAGNVAPEADWVIQVQAQQQQQYGWQLDNPPQAQPAQHVDLEEQHFPAEALHLGAEVDVGAFYKQHKYDFENAWPNPPHKDQYIFAVSFNGSCLPNRPCSRFSTLSQTFLLQCPHSFGCSVDIAHTPLRVFSCAGHHCPKVPARPPLWGSSHKYTALHRSAMTCSAAPCWAHDSALADCWWCCS